MVKTLKAKSRKKPAKKKAMKVQSKFQFAETKEGPQRVVVIHDRAIGSQGTEIFSGYINEEYLASLRGTQRADEFDKMRRGDAQVKMCLSAVKNSIRAGTWEVEPGAEGEDLKKHSDLVNHILFHDMKPRFKKFLGEALTIGEFGHAFFEIVHKVVENHKEFGTFNGIKTLAFRSQKTIERFNVDKDTGELISITQYAYGDLQRLVDIPAQFLLPIVLEQEGSNYEGMSLLRPCYGPWKRKEVYLKLNAIGVEKFAIPTPIGKVPDGVQTSAQFANFIEALENYVNHHSSYLTIPTGWEVELNNNTYDPAKVEESINNEDKRIAKAFLANFLELGTGGSGGAFALSNDLSDFFLGGIQAIADEIISVVNDVLIPSIVKMNFGPQEKYPVLKVSGITDKAGTELANILKSLKDGAMLTPDDQLEEHLRKRYGIPTVWENKRADQEQADPLGEETDLDDPESEDPEADPKADPKLVDKSEDPKAKMAPKKKIVKTDVVKEMKELKLSERIAAVIKARRK